MARNPGPPKASSLIETPLLWTPHGRNTLEFDKFFLIVPVKEETLGALDPVLPWLGLTRRVCSAQPVFATSDSSLVYY